MSFTTHDIVVDGKKFIMELRLNDEGTSSMELTEACDCSDDNECHDTLETYDFTEVMG